MRVIQVKELPAKTGSHLVSLPLNFNKLSVNLNKRTGCIEISYECDTRICIVKREICVFKTNDNIGFEPKEYLGSVHLAESGSLHAYLLRSDRLMRKKFK